MKNSNGITDKINCDDVVPSSKPSHHTENKSKSYQDSSEIKILGDPIHRLDPRNTQIKNKKDLQKCSQCLENKNVKLIKCFLCDKKRCKPCIDKEVQNTHILKRETSTYICADCLNNQKKQKLRPKQSEMRDDNNDSDSQSNEYDLNENLSKRKRIRRRTPEISILDMDCVYECITPPSELSSQKIKASSLRKKIIENASCHQCNEAKDTLVKCSNTSCDQSYCNNCIKDYSTNTYDKCYKCQEICKCSKCNPRVNEVRIGNFTIIEKEIQDCSRNTSYEAPEEIKPKGEERLPLNSNMTQICLICKSAKANPIEFKSLDDFVYYTKNFFENEAAILSNSKDDFFKSRKEFMDYYNNYENFYRNNQFVFKSIRYMCKECYIDHLKDNKSFYDLFNCLRICRHLMIGSRKQRQDQRLDQRTQDKNQISPETPNKDNTENKAKVIIIPNNNNSFNKLKENLIKMEDLTANNNQDINGINNMNIDPLKGSNNINAYMNNLVDEIKRQFFNVQYQSLMQKLLMSYIFKTIDSCNEKMNENQTLCDFIINNMINTIQRNSETTQNLEFNKEFLEQMNLLKGVSSRFNILANALNSNMIELKTNGMKFFKTSTEPASSNTTIENDFNSTMDQLKSLMTLLEKNHTLNNPNLNTMNISTNLIGNNPNDTGSQMNENSIDNIIKNFNLIKAYTTNMYNNSNNNNNINNNMNNQNQMFNQTTNSNGFNPNILNSNLIANLLSKSNNPNLMGMNMNNQVNPNSFIPNFDPNRFNYDQLRTLNNPMMNYQMPLLNNQLNMNVNNIPSTIGYDNYIKAIENINIPLINETNQNLNNLLYNNLNNQNNILHPNIPYQVPFSNNPNPPEADFKHDNNEHVKDEFNQHK